LLQLYPLFSSVLFNNAFSKTYIVIAGHINTEYWFNTFSNNLRYMQDRRTVMNLHTSCSHDQ